MQSLSRRQFFRGIPWCVFASRATGAQVVQGGTGRHNVEERYALFRKNLELRGSAITESQFRGISGLPEWRSRRGEIRRQFLDSLGLDPLPARSPLNVKVTGAFQRPRYRVENIVFESMPEFYVTGNLYLPETSGKVPAILYVSGHSPGPNGAKADYQRHGIWFAQNGFAALLLDTIEFGEIPGIHHGTHDLEMWHWLSLGYSPAAPEVWNAIRALDYLETRKEIDASRIGMTGRSGGGAITWFTAAVDDRIKAAVPVHGTWTVGPHVSGDVVRENCDCIYFWNPWQLDLSAVGALIAPRALKIVNASKDGAFPPAGYRKLFEMLQPVYSWHGAQERLAEFEMPTGHSDLPPYRKAANEWLVRWLTGKQVTFDETERDIELAEPQQLRVLKAQPANARNEGIHRDFIASHAITRPGSLQEWQRRKSQILADLREKVFGAFPKQKVSFDVWKGPERVWTTRYAESFNVEFSTEESVRVQAQLFVPMNGKATHPALIYAKGESDVVYGVDYDNLLSALGNHVILVLKPRAVDYPMDNFRLAATKMTAALLGSTLESMQLWDVLRSLDYLVDEEKLRLSTISVYGRKAMSVTAMYAGALDGRVTRVIVDDPPDSHWQGPAYLNVLRYTDIPEVAGLIAPREIVSLTRVPSAFDLTSHIMKLQPNSSRIREARGLADALRVWEY